MPSGRVGSIHGSKVLTRFRHVARSTMQLWVVEEMLPMCPKSAVKCSNIIVNKQITTNICDVFKLQAELHIMSTIGDIRLLDLHILTYSWPRWVGLSQCSGTVRRGRESRAGRWRSCRRLLSDFPAARRPTVRRNALAAMRSAPAPSTTALENTSRWTDLYCGTVKKNLKM